MYLHDKQLQYFRGVHLKLRNYKLGLQSIIACMKKVCPRLTIRICNNILGEEETGATRLVKTLTIS